MRIKYLVKRISKKSKKYSPIFVFIKSSYFSINDSLVDKLKNYFPDFLNINIGNYLKDGAAEGFIDSYLLSQLISDLNDLASGKSIELPLYDLHEARQIGKSTINPEKIIFIEGPCVNKVRKIISNRFQNIYIRNSK